MMGAQRIEVRAGRPATRWILPCMVGTAVLFGTAIGAESRVATPALGAAAVPLLLTLSLPWLASLSLVTALVFRVAAPAATGPAALIPDLLVLLVCARALADLALGRGRPLPSGVRRMAWFVLAFLALTFASTLVSGDRLMVWGQSMRQFLRFPLWALALSTADLGAVGAKRLVKLLLGVSVLQFPLALYQFSHPVADTVIQGIHFYQGDNVAGTFGYGGSGTEMIFLVICAVVWLPLAFGRVVPVWLLWLLAPALVLPMALGSAASYVLFLPLGILGLIIKALTSHRFRLTAGGLVMGGLLLVVSVWAAGALAIAPGFSASDQPTGTALFSQSYLSRYLSESGGSSQPGSRVGFLKFAIGSDLRTGWTGVAVGHGPSLSILDASGPDRLQGELGDHTALAVRSVQSLQRLLIGFGFVAPALFVLIVLVPVLRLRRAQVTDPLISAVTWALPVVAVVYLTAGVYNSPWSDPGVSAALWTLVVAAYAGVAAEGRQEAEGAEAREPSALAHRAAPTASWDGMA